MVSWIFFLLFSFYLKSAQSSPQWELKSCEPNCALRLEQMGVRVKFLQDNCKCENSICQCCFQGSFPQSNMTQEFCMQSAFRAEYLELQVKATMNGNTMGQFMLSGRNPPPLCFPVPFPIPIPLSMCIRGMDIYPKDNNMHLCVDMLMRFSGFEFLTLHLNCMWIGLGGVQFVNQR
ncbi:uncharacterized protein LOC129916740 [Episyrphus balteatus]|uniref:uncharacterized protein LOC129916740 n=1 Tax=Episyrphus balteatus TaxID=286459 RepID=UPI002485DFA9|nr:uncharacterized protein LOC129916740 [Episyrphus balteatus]